MTLRSSSSRQTTAALADVAAGAWLKWHTVNEHSTKPTALAGSRDIYRYAGWEYQPQERLLLVEGRPTRLGGRALDLLRALIEHGGRVAAKDELLAAAWPGLVVEENNLSVQIAALRKVLGAGAIATVAGVGYRLVAEPLEPERAPPGNRLPARPVAPRLFGRNEDLQRLQDLVGSDQLVSIVGAGGVGKTSLALNLLDRNTTTWADGRHWIDLAPLSAGAAVLPLLAKSMGISLQDFALAPDDFLPSLAGLNALIVLDNCEHVLDAVGALVTAAFQQAPGIRWLVTTQEPLRLVGETVYRLEPLRLPPRGTHLPAALDCGAIELLRARANDADRHFDVDAGNLEAAIELCHQLDGLPLAIEMAAARVGSLGLSSVLTQIDQRLRLRAGARDVPSRHRTLLQTFEWSYGLLTEVEQRVFRRLEPFLDGFTIAMAYDVCRLPADGDPNWLDKWRFHELVAVLVDKSLVHRSPDVPGRFHLLASARDYARVQLELNEELAAVCARFVWTVVGSFRNTHRDIDNMPDYEWATRYLPERHNLRAALVLALAMNDGQQLAVLVTALAQMDIFAQIQAEVVQLNIPMTLLEQAPREDRGWALLELGWAHYLDGSREAGTDFVSRALEDFEAVGDHAGRHRALMRLIRLFEGRPGLHAQAQAFRVRLLNIDERQVPPRSRLNAAITLGVESGVADVVERLQQLYGVALRSGFEIQAAMCCTNITDGLLRQGRYDEVVSVARILTANVDPNVRSTALIRHNEALALVRLGRVREAEWAARAVLRARPSLAHMIVDIFALAAMTQGRYVDASLMAGYAARVKRARDHHSDPTETAAIAETLQCLTSEFGEKRLNELMAAGAAMQTVEILAITFSEKNDISDSKLLMSVSGASRAS